MVKSAHRIKVAEVAAKLGRSERWFKAHRAELEAHGFPRPLIIANTYDPAAVDLWISQSASTAPAPRPTLLDQYRANRCPQSA